MPILASGPWSQAEVLLSSTRTPSGLLVSRGEYPVVRYQRAKRIGGFFVAKNTLLNRNLHSSPTSRPGHTATSLTRRQDPYGIANPQLHSHTTCDLTDYA